MTLRDLRDRSLIMGVGAPEREREGGGSEVLPLQRGGGGRKSVCHAEVCVCVEGGGRGGCKQFRSRF